MKQIIYHIGNINNPGGMERVVVLKANWLAEHGYDVTLLSKGKSHESYFPLSEKVHCASLNVFQGKEWDVKRNFIGAIKSLYWGVKSRIDHKRKLKEYLQEHPCDYFITLINRGFIPKLKDGSKKYFEIHFSSQSKIEFAKIISNPYRLLYKVGMWYQERIYKHYDKFIVLTKKDAAMRGKIKNMQVLPNFITVDIPDTAALQQNKTVISVGRLSIQKGYDYLFQAWAKVKALHPDWTLEIYGYGYGREAEYNRMIREAGVEDVVTLHAPVKDIQQKYLDASFYVMSSRYEGFPLVLGEAMACGLPCVSFDCNCGPGEIIRHGEDGLLVDKVGDVDGLAESINRMIEDKDMCIAMGKKAIENIVRFEINNIMKQWVEILK